MRVLPYGERALLAEFDSLDEAIAAFRALDATTPNGVTELVPAARTVLVRVDPDRLSLRAVEEWLRATQPMHAENGMEAKATIPVRYNGPDLASTASLLGITRDELVSRHSTATWRCAFIGFAPGFAYLVGGGMDVPRHATSRSSVPAGSVSLAGEFTAVYPRGSPGGWQLIGTTDAVLWDETREFPSRIAPGMSVRFEVIEG